MGLVFDLSDLELGSRAWAFGGLERQALLGLGVPYVNAFSGTCYLKGTSMKSTSVPFSVFLLGYFKPRWQPKA